MCEGAAAADNFMKGLFSKFSEGTHATISVKIRGGLLKRVLGEISRGNSGV